MSKPWIALAVIMTAGCATIEDRPPSEDVAAAWQQRQIRLAALDHWQIRGRMSARTPDEGWTASMLWVRQNDRHAIDLWGPLGRGHMRLSQDPSGAQLRDARNNTYWARDGKQLLFDITGWWLPLDSLNYWVLGMPVPAAPNVQTLDELGRLKRLRQLGWDIDFQQYRRHGDYDLPSKLFIRRRLNAAEVSNPDVDRLTLEVRLVIERWTMQPS
ncbi:MAG: lipoprotein insertase outer membrane protein LolB [Acidiferrobacterales bacterium]|nr:lipoprotein insertase outer membrane protein LolB [Acidiferrobacterales bacterium]